MAMRACKTKRVLPNKKTLAKLHHLRGRHYKLVHCHKKRSNWYMHCEECDLASLISQTNPRCMPFKAKAMYCVNHVYKEVDPLYAALMEAKEAR
jgi:hypothetical protein